MLIGRARMLSYRLLLSISSERFDRNLFIYFYRILSIFEFYEALKYAKENPAQNLLKEVYI